MDKVQKIRNEVARIQLYTQSEVLKQVLDYIDEVQKEPVSEVLVECTSETILEGTNFNKSWYAHPELAFRAGAQWHKKQMMSKAIGGYVIEDIEEGNGDFLLSAEYLPESRGLKDRQKVKVIVIKED